MIPTLHICLLGDFSLMSDDTPVTSITIPRVQSLLAYLMLHRHAPQNRSHLAFLLWPDSTEAQAHTNLRQLLYHLRQALPYANQFLYVDKQSLQWLPAQGNDTFTLDVQELEQALVRARQAEHIRNTSMQRQELEQVLLLYRGDLLPSCYEEWILPERDRLRQLFLQSAERLLALLEQDQDYAAAITIAQRLLRADPLDEAACRQLMRLHALHGDRAAALRTYHTFARLLERELGVESGEMTQAIYTSLKQFDEPGAMPTRTPPNQRTEAPLQGRNAEWRKLQQAWNSVTGGIAGHQIGKPQIVLLSGEAGIGKSRLARELEVWVSRSGMTTMSARCYAAPGHLPYAPVISWLRSEPLQARLSSLDPTTLTEIARVVPEVLITHPHLSPPTAMTEGWQRQCFFAALVRALLSARQPLLLLIDDLHWCDQETLEWLHYLFYFSSAARLLLVGTVRVEEMAPVHPLPTFLGMLQRDGLVTEIPLGPLTLAETTALAEYMLGNQIDPTVSDRLYQETEGNPLFVVEMVRADSVSNNADSKPSSQGSLSLYTHTASPLPPTVQTVLATRLAQLSPQARNVASVAAVIGREFVFPVLVHTCGEKEEYVVQGLDELWRRRIVREHGSQAANAYDFSHDKLREHSIASLSPAHRRLLHQRVAEAFKAIYVEDEDVVCGLIAAHYEQAGLFVQAIPFYQKAANAAKRIYAHTEALHGFRRAAALLTAHQPGLPQAGLSWEVAVQIYTSLGDTYVETGSYEDARQAYQCALTSVPPEAYIWRARAHWKIATTWTYSFAGKHDSSYNKSIQAFEEAERILTQVADSANQDWRDEWLALHFARVWRGSADDMEATIEKARPVVEQYGTQEQRRRYAQAIGIHNAIRNHFVIPADHVAAWRSTIAALGPTKNEVERGMDLALSGIGLVSASQFDEAQEQLRLALHLGERTGNAWLQRNCLTFLPFALRSHGQLEEMRRILARAEAMGITLNSRIHAGHNAWVAWRDGNLVLAETYGREAIQEESSRQIRPNPFLWTGRWPLIGVALAREQISTAIDHIRLLFASTQQPPHEPLNMHLTEVLHTWDAGEQEKAYGMLQHLLPLAEQMGYL